MSELDQLLAAYRRHVSTPWQSGLAGAEKVWFVVYPPEKEKQVRLRVPDFALATNDAGHKWVLLDITDDFGKWMGAHEYREGYFAAPTDIEMALADYLDQLVAHITDVVRKADENTVVALLGVGSLFGFTRLSEVVPRFQREIRGRVAVLFPGTYDEKRTYRLLDARDGWNYLAVPITAHSGVIER